MAKLGIRGSDSFNGLVSTSDVEEVSQLAIECLHELMLKRYIPNNRGPDGNVQGSSSDMSCTWHPTLSGSCRSM